jgi:predicted phage tail protein
MQALDVLAENRFKENRFKFDGLEDGQYFVRLTAIDALGLEGLPLTTAFTLKARPEPPFSIQPKNKVRAASVDFTWTEAAHAYAYHLQVAKDAEFKNIILDQADIKDVQFSSTLPQGEYFWRIATVIQKNGQFDQGPYGDIQSFQKLAATSSSLFQRFSEQADFFQLDSRTGAKIPDSNRT